MFLKRIVPVCLALICTLCAVSCKSSAVREQVRSIPYKSLEHYAFDPSSALVDRVDECPDIVLSYYREMDATPSYTPYSPSRREMTEIARCLSLLPSVHRRVLDNRLVGIYFIENFLGSGMADYVLDEDDTMYLILIFNPRTLKSTLTEYVSYKETSCFIRDDPETEIKIELSDEYSGFLYILLHETTHCVDYIERFTPFVEPHLVDLQGVGGRDTTFSKTVWEAYDTIREEASFPYREHITFYGFNGGPKLRFSEAASVYAALESTPFVSLYSSFNWAEDFAEYITYYYFVHGLELDYRIVVKRDGSVLHRYEPFCRQEIQKRSGQLDRDLVASLERIPRGM